MAQYRTERSASGAPLVIGLHVGAKTVLLGVALLRRQRGRRKEERAMGTYFSEREFAPVEPAENAFRSPIPTQVVSNGEFNPPAQTAQQKQVEARIKEVADTYGAKLGMDR